MTNIERFSSNKYEAYAFDEIGGKSITVKLGNISQEKFLVKPKYRTHSTALLLAKIRLP